VKARRLVALTALACTCGAAGAGEPQGSLTLCNAGSLAAPLGAALAAFAGAHPAVTPQQESAGSLDIVRRVTELGRPCDVLAVADFEIMPALVVPAHAAWYVVFARNRLVIAHRPDSRHAPELADHHWYDVLTRDDVAVGRSDPDADPAGYRALLAWRLAERHYAVPGLAARLLAHAPARYVRPKSVELTALLQAGELDYVWAYASVAAEAHLAAIRLPPEIDLGDFARATDYAAVSVEVAGNQPGTRRTVYGLPILYALTIPTKAPNPPVAEAFLDYVFSEAGSRILREHHLDLLDSLQASDPALLPAGIRARAVPLAFPVPPR
jgi:molybdate/tungstate transport system substrate-binding protein